MILNAIIQQPEGIIPSIGFTIEGLIRGGIGMVFVIVLAFLFSSNRKAISWKTVGIGLGIQLLLAFGILRISFIQKALNGLEIFL